MTRTAKYGCRIVACVSLAFLCSGCASDSIQNKRLARYRPETGERTPWLWNQSSAPTRAEEDNADASKSVSRSLVSRTLAHSDRVDIYLRGIPQPEDIIDVIDDLGNVNLPLTGRVRIEGKTTSEAEVLIEKRYIEGGYYKNINVIVVAQADEYFVRGEVKREGRYPLIGDLTLLKAIATAGGYTDYAKSSRIQVISGKKILAFDARKIERLKAEDPLIKPGDVIIVPRRIAW